MLADVRHSIHSTSHEIASIEFGSKIMIVKRTSQRRAAQAERRSLVSNFTMLIPGGLPVDAGDLTQFPGIFSEGSPLRFHTTGESTKVVIFRRLDRLCCSGPQWPLTGDFGHPYPGWRTQDQILGLNTSAGTAWVEGPFRQITFPAVAERYCGPSHLQ